MSKFLITGSVAAHHWLYDFRQPNDIDIITESEIKISNSKPSELSIEIYHGDIFNTILQQNRDPVFVDMDMLYTIKMSHAQWDIKWDKTINDIITFQTHDAHLLPIYGDLVKHWETIHGPKRVNLNMSNDEFFTDAVKRQIDHDRLHELVAFTGTPMHTHIRHDLKSPKADKALWDDLSWFEKMNTALEEIAVIAIERGHLTKDSKQHEIKIACKKAYKSLVTTMTKGWFCDFLLENAYGLLRNGIIILHAHICNVVKSETFIMEMKNGIEQRI